MNSLQKLLFALICGYVISQMFGLSYKDSMSVAYISASPILVIWLLDNVTLFRKQKMIRKGKAPSPKVGYLERFFFILFRGTFSHKSFDYPLKAAST
jgi:hypothetical protein